MLADTSTVETKNVDKAKVPVDGHISAGRIVRFPFMLGGG